MKYNINLALDQTLSISVFEEEDQTFNINLFIPKKSNLKDVLKKETLLNLLKKELEYEKQFPQIFPISIEGIEHILKTDLDILNNCNYISIDPNDEGIKEFLDKNTTNDDISLLLNERYKVNREDLNSVIKNFGKYKNLKVLIDGNEEPISLLEYQQTIEIIEEITNKITKYNLSPLEQIAYAYDLVRNRIYKKEDENEPDITSRDLTKVLLGDKIVCKGYSNIFEKVLTNLNINNRMYYLKNKYSKRLGHASNIVYVKDEKYGIDGIFYFDVTWGSKDSINDLGYLDSYKFFCKQKFEMDNYFRHLTEYTFEGLDEDFIPNFLSQVQRKGINNIPKRMIKTLNNISELVDKKNLINMDFSNCQKQIEYSFNLKESMSDLLRYQQLLFDPDNYLNPEILLKVLYNVRKIEYYEEPDKYPFDIKNFEKIMVYNNSQDKKENLLLAILNPEGMLTQMTHHEFEESSKKEELELNIQRVKLAKTLRLTYEKNNTK